MSIWQRDKAAYDWEPVDTSYSNNPHILAWWTPTHDRTLLSLIDEWQWDWPWHVTDAILNITPNDILETWRQADPICRDYAWYNVIMYFALARARVKGFDNRVRKPIWKKCLVCGNEFIESSLSSPVIARLGIDGLDFCSPCLTKATFEPIGHSTMSREQVIEYLRELTEAIEQVPHQGYGVSLDYLRYWSKEQRVKTLRVLQRKPSVERVKQLFGSWLNALIESRVLEDGTRKTSRGTQCVAKDGHVCYSLAEKTIDDYLHFHNIKHEKEPPYPTSNMRADFKVGGVFVEYFGLCGDPEYDAKTREKSALCIKHGISLISLYPEDVVNRSMLEKKLLTTMQSNQPMQPPAGSVPDCKEKEY